MGSNKKENLVFTTIMCALMVFGMSVYNVFLLEGISTGWFKDVLIGYVPAFVVGLILDVFIVGRLAKGIAHKFIKENDPIVKKVLMISCCMVTGMVFLMSFYGAVTHVGFSAALPEAYLSNLWRNFVCALPLQIILVGPLTRFIFMKIYPVPVPAAS